MPLRAYWPGTDPDWTYRGFNFAWRVMLVEKAGYTEFIACDRATGTAVAGATARLRDRAPGKDDGAGSVHGPCAGAPHRRRSATHRGVWPSVEVRAESFAALNGRPVQRLIDPHVDLGGPALRDWIVPLRRHGAADRAVIAVIDPEGGQ